MNRSATLITLLALTLVSENVLGQDLQAVPPPMVEETFLPRLYYSFDFALVQPSFRGYNQDGISFSPQLDWTISPRFEIGLLNRGSWNPYVGYRGIYSDSSATAYEPFTESIVDFFHSTELHALDLGLLSETFPLLGVIRAQWDVSARLTIADFYNRFAIEFNDPMSSYAVARLRQQFVGAGPRAGLRVELPFADSGLSLAGNVDGGVQWGSYRASANIESRFDNEFEHANDKVSEGGLLWHVGAQLALKYSPPRYCDRLSFSAGYLYEAWFSKDMGIVDGSEFGRFDYHGPFFRMEWKY